LEPAWLLIVMPAIGTGLNQSPDTLLSVRDVALALVAPAMAIATSTAPTIVAFLIPPPRGSLLSELRLGRG
jgi:hypothetical protein